MRPRRLTAAAAALLLVASAPSDPFERTVTALARGGSGSGGAARSSHTRAAAAQALIEAGATPLQGEDDVAARWLHDAHAVPSPIRYRDRVLGPGYRTIRLPRGGTLRFDQTFLAGQRARVAVVPMRQAEFAMAITDDEKRGICAASRRRARCDWVPAFTTRFSIELRNAAPGPAAYFMVIE